MQFRLCAGFYGHPEGYTLFYKIRLNLNAFKYNNSDETNVLYVIMKEITGEI